jgi:hypothetical protein
MPLRCCQIYFAVISPMLFSLLMYHFRRHFVILRRHYFRRFRRRCHIDAAAAAISYAIFISIFS